MIDRDAIVAEMEVYGADGVHVGSVDGLDGERIRLNTVASSVAVEGGHDHHVRLAEVERIEGNRIHLAAAGVDAVHPRPGTAAAHPQRGAIDPDATHRR